MIMIESLHKVLQSSTVSYAMLLYSHKSWMVQTCKSRAKARCSVVSSDLPHLHKAGPTVEKPHFVDMLFALTPLVRSLLKHRQFFQGPWCAGARDSVDSTQCLSWGACLAIFSKGAGVLPSWECQGRV